MAHMYHHIRLDPRYDAIKEQASSHCVIYRIGTRAKFTWYRTMPVDKATAVDQCLSIRAAGFLAMVERFSLSTAVGLPTTYLATDNLLD
jgi:hypothetical protein